MHYCNKEILEIGAMYTGHFDNVSIRVIGDTWHFDIPSCKMREFTDIFPDINWEDGYYLEKLKGRYIRLYDDGCKYKIVKHITKDLTYEIT